MTKQRASGIVLLAVSKNETIPLRLTQLVALHGIFKNIDRVHYALVRNDGADKTELEAAGQPESRDHFLVVRTNVLAMKNIVADACGGCMWGARTLPRARSRGQVMARLGNRRRHRP